MSRRRIVVQVEDEGPPSPPQLPDELEAKILAGVPLSEYDVVCAVVPRFRWLIKSGEVYRIRRDDGLVEPTVFVLAAGAQVWWAFDRRLRWLRNLPVLPAGEPFRNGDKETLCAGTHLLVSGKEDGGAPAVWRYCLVSNRWFRGPHMINPRSMFAAATTRSGFGYVAGGMLQVGVGNEVENLNSAERYNSKSGEWEILPSMHRKRKNCSGCYMDGKFHVVGGRNDEDGQLTCGEAYDEQNRAWELIPDMLEPALAPSQTPPLIAVVDNELYSLDVSSNHLKLYVKAENWWRSLGPVPVVAHLFGGWGVAFKSLGDELLVIGGNANAFAGPALIYACRPDPAGAAAPDWRLLENEGDQLNNPFILNCSVMFA